MQGGLRRTTLLLRVTTLFEKKLGEILFSNEMQILIRNSPKRAFNVAKILISWMPFSQLPVVRMVLTDPECKLNFGISNQALSQNFQKDFLNTGIEQACRDLMFRHIVENVLEACN